MFRGSEPTPVRTFRHTEAVSLELWRDVSVGGVSRNSTLKGTSLQPRARCIGVQFATQPQAALLSTRPVGLASKHVLQKNMLHSASATGRLADPSDIPLKSIGHLSDTASAERTCSFQSAAHTRTQETRTAACGSLLYVRRPAGKPIETKVLSSDQMADAIALMPLISGVMPTNEDRHIQVAGANDRLAHTSFKVTGATRPLAVVSRIAD